VNFDACKIRDNNNYTLATIWVDKSYWGVAGWEVTNGASQYAACFGAFPNPTDRAQIHHIIFANNVANGCGLAGFGSANEGNLFGVDYLAIVGNIAYRGTQGHGECGSGITIFQPVASDQLAGTHLYIAGNFSFENVDANPCDGKSPTDGEGITLDSLSGLNTRGLPSYDQQAVVENNVLVFNGNAGFGGGGSGNQLAPIYLRHNTMYGNFTDSNQSDSVCGQMTLGGYPPAAQSSINLVQAYLNLAMPSGSTEPACGSNRAYAYYAYNATSTDHVYQNFGYSAAGNNTQVTNSTGFSFDSNNVFGTNPGFPNPVAPGAPSCSTYSSVPACMAQVIANFTPTNPAAAGYGYQMPSSASVYDPLFPQWLCSVNLPQGLVTPGCLSGP
jgi:hypothetical protein